MTYMAISDMDFSPLITFLSQGSGRNKDPKDLGFNSFRFGTNKAPDGFTDIFFNNL